MRQGGQPQRVLAAQGTVRPGLVQAAQHWVWRTWRDLPEQLRRPTPSRRPDLRLANRVLR